MSAQLRAQVDKLLTDASSAYIPSEFVCERILPEVQVAQSSGLFGKWGTSHLRIENSIKGGRGKYRQVQTRATSTVSYLVEGHGLEGFVSAEDYRNVELPFNAENDEALGLATTLWLEKEKALADTLTSSSIITQYTTLSGTSQFSDYLNSDPIGVAATARAAILVGCGVMPNVAIMDLLVWNKLRFHPAMLDSLGFKQARPGGLTKQEMALALGVDDVIYGAARYESAAEGQTSSLAAVWGKHLVFAVSPQKASKQQVSVGYMVRLAGSSPRKVFKQAQFNPPGSTSILVEDSYDMLISNVGAAYLVKDVIA